MLKDNFKYNHYYHDILLNDCKNQLDAIRLYAYIIMDELKIKNKEVKRYCKNIIKSTKITTRLIEKVACLPNGEYELFCTIDVHEIIKEVIDLFNKKLDENISICLNLKADSSIIFGNPTMLYNMFVDLVIRLKDSLTKNEKTVLYIYTERIDVDHLYMDSISINITPGNYLKISIPGLGIKDNGFFEFFHSLDTYKSKEVEESQLSIYQIVKNHKGKIQLVENEGAERDECEIYLPLLSYSKGDLFF